MGESRSRENFASYLRVPIASRDSDAIAAILLGGAAANPALSIHLGTASVHVLVLISALWLLRHPNRCFRLRISGRHAAVGAASLPLVASVAWGPFVNDPNLAIVLIGLLLASIVVAELSQQHRQHLSSSFVWVNSIGCALALLQVGGLVSSNLMHQEISAIGRPSGWYGEPDWLGLFAGVTILVCLVDHSLSSRARGVGLLLAIAALVLSFARAAWIAVAVALLLRMLVARLTMTTYRPSHVIRYVVMACLGLTAVAIAAPALRSDLSTRVANIAGGGAEDVSGQARKLQSDTLIQLARDAPWYGAGLSASGRVGVSGRLILEGESPNNVGSNWILALWVDGKIFALPLIVAVLTLVVPRGSNVYWSALVVVLVSSLVSNAFYFPLTWFLVGMLSSRQRPVRVPTKTGVLVA